MARTRPKVVYILPLYDSKIGSHFFHIYEMLMASARELDIFLVIERAAEIPQDFPFPVYRQRFAWMPFRFIELVLILLWARLHGRRLFYTHYSFFGGICSWLVSTVAGGRPYYWNAGMPWLYERGRFEEAVFRFILQHCTLVTGTAGLAREYERHYGLNHQKVRVLPNWVNLSRFQKHDRVRSREILNIARDAKLILFVHHLSRRKGAHLLPEIASRVLHREKHAIFLIVGDGPERKNLELRIENLGLKERVRIIGEVPHRDIPSYFAVADVLLMPSEEEGFPHVLLEAMAVGIPYVASDVGGVREITPPILENHIVRSGDIHSYAEAILSLLQHSKQDRAKIGTVEQDWVLRYDLSSVCRLFISLFHA